MLIIKTFFLFIILTCWHLKSICMLLINKCFVYLLCFGIWLNQFFFLIITFTSFNILQMHWIWYKRVHNYIYVSLMDTTSSIHPWVDFNVLQWLNFFSFQRSLVQNKNGFCSYLVFDCHVNFFLVKSYPDEDLSSNSK